MATLPTSIKVNRQDIQNAPPWVFPMLSIYNTFNQAVYDALNGNLTYSENVRCQIKELTFRTLQTYNSGDWDILQFVCPLKVKPVGLTLLQIYRTDNVVILQPVFVNWQYVNGNIVLPWITGLENATEYTLRVRVE